MAALKDLYDKNTLSRISDSLTGVYPSFDSHKFKKIIKEFDALEMKPRVQLIRDELSRLLPEKYPDALKILIRSLDSGKLRGFDLWPYTEFIQTYGLKDIDLSLKALSKMTILFTGEFAVRPFIRLHEKTTMDFLLKCASDKNVHLRRWASEGSRPRLPWGEKLHGFVKDPAPTLPILEKLKFDEELYVRKSVSNHLNDIAKDHPELVVRILTYWKKEAGKVHEAKIDWIIHRSLRTLIKNGHPGALKLIGVSSKTDIKASLLKVSGKKFHLNDRMEFSFELESTSAKEQKIVVDYIIHYVKANKTLSGKVFKLKTLNLKGRERVTITKSHHLKEITTRVYHPGKHTLEIQINGKVYLQAFWDLSV